MKFVGSHEIRQWLANADRLSEFAHGIGAPTSSGQTFSSAMPFHLEFLIRQLASTEIGDGVSGDALDSIPFYSLCRALFLPLSMLDPSRTASIFGLKTERPPNHSERENLLRKFLSTNIGLTLPEQVGCIFGDVFLGGRSSVRRDSLLRLLMTTCLSGRTEMLDKLAQVGDIAILFAESRPDPIPTSPLTAAEVIRTLQKLPLAKRNSKFRILRSLLERCSKLEAYFLARLLLQKAGLGFEFQGTLIAQLLAEKFRVDPDQVSHAMALTDAYKVAEVLVKEGADGLRKIQLQPLVPVRPMLAGGSTHDLTNDDFPVWVERKYDGIRLLLHKSTDARGSILCGAYTRNRGDWLEQIPGMDAAIRQIPATNCIVDGELYGTILDLEAGSRPASVYEVYSSLQGQNGPPVNLRFAAFDLLYVNGVDITRQALHARRQSLMNLFGPVVGLPLPIPFSISEGQMAEDAADINRLFQHFRSQGYEGIISKQLNDPYRLASRDAGWRKRKPEITLDLVITGALQAVTTKTNAGLFGSFTIGARDSEGRYQFVGDVAGIDRLREQDIHREIMREGLFTGERIERPSASGARSGFALKPAIVVTVRFEGIARDNVTGALSLRDPKLVVIRSDKSASEANSVSDLEEIYLRQRVG